MSSILGFMILLIIAGICGALAEAVIGFSPGGFLVSIAVGLVGAYLGTWLAHTLALPQIWLITIENQSIDVIWTMVGALIFLAVIAVLRGRRRRRYLR